ncbi:MAG: M20 family metallopeptidase [Deltaproteobacteria bacterium]|nr:M20 family metallopeptidase [Deltaproteobacteria bacterium]
MAAQVNALALTRKLLSFNTINPPGQERQCAQYLGKLLEDGGFKVAYYDFAESRTSLIARLEGRGDQPPICFSGHLDTVPLGAESWSKDPFSGEVDGNRVYGRGASDMKSGIAAMVSTALRLPKILQEKAGVTFIFTAGEETGSQGATYLAGLSQVLGPCGALVVGEPTSNYPLVGHKGCLWLEIETTGITAHGSMPEQGDNAIYKAVEAVNKLQEFDFNVAPHPFLGKPTLNVGTIAGGLNINSVPDRTVVGVDIRTIPSLPHDEVCEKMKSYLGEDVKIKSLVDMGSVTTDPENEWIQALFDIMESFLGNRPEPRGVAYFTDASILTPAFDLPPTVIMGPGEPGMAHKTDEFCRVSKIEEAAEAYFEIAKSWCHG